MIFKKRDNNLDKKIEKEFKELTSDLKSYYSARKIEKSDLLETDLKMRERISKPVENIFNRIMTGLQTNRKILAYSTLSLAAVLLLSIIGYQYLTTISKEKVSAPLALPNVQTVPLIKLVKSAESFEGVDTKSSFTIISEKKLDQESTKSHIKIEPEIEYALNWKSEKEFEITPTQDLSKETIYTVTLEKGVVLGEREELENTLDWKFETTPVFSIIGITPKSGSTGAPADTAIEVELNYRNIDMESFNANFSIEPAVAGRTELIDNKVVFLPDTPLNPDISYIINVGNGVRTTTGEIIENGSTSYFQVSTYTSDAKSVSLPYFSIYPSTRVLTTSTIPEVSVNLEQLNKGVKVKVYSMEKGGLLSAMSLPENSIDQLVRPEESLLNLVSEHEILEDQKLEFSEINEGLYFVEYTSPELNESKFQIINYSKYGLYFVDGINYDNIWGFNLENNSILTGIDLELYKFSTSAELVGTIQLSEGGRVEEDSNFHLIVGEINGKIFLLDKISTSDWGWGIFKSSDLGWSNDKAGYRGYIYTDRPIYKPGDTVKFKAIVRKENDFNYTVEKGLNIRVAVPKSTSWYEEKFFYFQKEYTIDNDFGTISGEFTLPGDLYEDYVYINLYNNDQQILDSDSIFVSIYTKPQFYINSELDKKEYFSGENATVTIDAKRYSGEPVNDKDIELRICTSRVYSPQWPDETYLEAEKKTGRFGYCQKTLENITGKLDSNGSLIHQFPVNFNSDDSNVGMLFVEAVIKGESNTDSIGTTTALIYEGNVDIFVKSSNQAYKGGQEVEINIGTFKSGTNIPSGSQDYSVTIERNWSEQYQSGTRYIERIKKTIPVYSYHYYDEVVANLSGTTNEDGLDTIKFLPQKDGHYDITTSINGYLKEQTYVFSILKESYADLENKNIEISALKTDLSAGNEIELQFVSTLDNEVPMLVTIQRADVYESKIVNVPVGASNLTLEKKDLYAPSITVKGAYTAQWTSYDGRTEKVIKTAGTNIKLDDTSQKVNITASTDKSIYEPGDEVQLNIKTTDINNNSVSSEVSVSAIDKALLNITYKQYDPTELENAFYQIVKQNAFVYISHQEMLEGGGGGGGGGERSDFKDGAYWNANVITDERGQASIKFKLPDNLTLWTLDMRAVTADTKVGQGTHDVQVSKDTYVSFLLPQFIRNKDKLVIPAQLINNTEAQFSGQLKITVEGGTIEGTTSYDISLNGKGNSFHNFTVIPQTQNTDTLKVRIAFESNGELIDAVTLSAPILPVGSFENRIQGAVVTNQNNTIIYNAGNEIELARSKYKLSLSPSIVGEKIHVSDFNYTDSSIELGNLISRNLSIIDNYDVIQPNQTKEVMMEQIKKSLEILIQIQDPSGGFGYFGYDTPNPETTSHVFEAIAKSFKNGYETGQLLERGTIYLRKQLQSSATSYQAKAYILYALSLADDEDILPVANYLFSTRAHFPDSPVTFSYLSLALANIGNTGDGLMLIPEIERLAKQTERWVWWEEPNIDFNLIQNKDIASTAAYDALESYNSSMAEKAMTYLLENRYCLSCQTTEATKLLIVLLKHHADEISNADINFSIKVNNNEQTIDNKINAGRVVEVEIPSNLFQPGENQIQISTNTDDKLYTKFYSEEFAPATSQESISNKLPVSTKYYNLLTGAEGTEFDTGTPVIMEITITPEIEVKMIDIIGFVPAGTEIFSTYLENQVSQEIMMKFYQQQIVTKSYSWGKRELDTKKFSIYSAEAEKTYKFSIPLLVVYKGSFQIPGARAFFKNSPDIAGQSGRVEFIGK